MESVSSIEEMANPSANGRPPATTTPVAPLADTTPSAAASNITTTATTSSNNSSMVTVAQVQAEPGSTTSCSSSPPSSSESEINENFLKCTKCASLVLRPNVGRSCRVKEVNLPSMGPKRSDIGADFPSDKLSQFWVVHDMYDFDNIAFTNTVGKTRYLACADCEIGPIGFQEVGEKNYYVSIDRIKTVAPPPQPQSSASAPAVATEGRTSSSS